MSLRDTYGLACPGCGNDTRLIVEISTLAMLTDDGTEVFGEQYWGDASVCRCPICHHHARVADFAIDEPDPVSNDHHCHRKDD